MSCKSEMHVRKLDDYNRHLDIILQVIKRCTALPISVCCSACSCFLINGIVLVDVVRRERVDDWCLQDNFSFIHVQRKAFLHEMVDQLSNTGEFAVLGLYLMCQVRHMYTHQHTPHITLISTHLTSHSPAHTSHHTHQHTPHITLTSTHLTSHSLTHTSHHTHQHTPHITLTSTHLATTGTIEIVRTKRKSQTFPVESTRRRC